MVKFSFEDKNLITNILSRYMKANNISQNQLGRSGILSTKTCQKILSKTYNNLHKKTLLKILSAKNLELDSKNLIEDIIDKYYPSNNKFLHKKPSKNIKIDKENMVDAFELFQAESDIFLKIARINRILINMSKYLSQETITLETLNLSSTNKDVRRRIKNPIKATLKIIEGLKNMLTNIIDDNIVYIDEEER